MIIEISVAVIALALVVWLTILSTIVIKTSKILRGAVKDINHISTEASNLMNKVNELLSDIQSKSDSLDVLFRPLRKGKIVREASETVSEIVDWVSTSLALFNKFKSVVKRREK